MKLDKSRPYGKIYGQHVIRFTQDGINYDGKGDPLPDQNKAAKKKATRKKAITKKDD